MKTLFFVGVLLLTFGKTQLLHAQGVVVRIAQTYTGPAIQTTATGQSTTGTFAMYVRTDGGVGGKTVFNGVASYYGGGLDGYNDPVPKTTGLAWVSLPRPYTIVNGKLVNGPKQPKIPLYIKVAQVYGGILNEDGSSLLLHGDPGPYPDPIALPAGYSPQTQRAR